MKETRIQKLPSNVSSTSMKEKQINIPKLCPRCGTVNNPIFYTDGLRRFTDGLVGFISCECPACSSWSFIIVHENADDKEKPWNLLTQYPDNYTKSFDSLLSECSPRFINAYNAAFDSEQNGYYDLAGMGYRASLEILIKDWALKYSGETREKIASYTLNDAIAHFLKNDAAAFAVSDVVRDFGNDFTHWNRPEDFDSQNNLEAVKTYLNIFVNLILLKLQIANPPAGRAHHSDSNNK